MKGYVLKPTEIGQETIEYKKCPKCGNKLYSRTVGYVCKNWKCENYWKRDGIFFTNRYG